jgi:hypothetical protein
MTHALSASSSDRRARRQHRRIDPAAIVAAAFFLAVCAAEMALIWHGASEMDAITLMSFVT